MNREYKKEILDYMSDNTAAATIEIMLDNIGRDLSNIINLDGDNLSDGECIDMIVQYLKDKGLYVERKS